MMTFTPIGEPKRIITRGGAGLGGGAGAVDPDPARPPRGLSRGLRDALHRRRGPDRGHGDGALLPGIEDGLDGMWFIAACQESSANDGAWVAR